MAFETLGSHLGAAAWAMGIFVVGFALSFAVVRCDVRSLLIFPNWILHLARKYLRPEINPVYLCAFIFLFNSAAIFLYMISGGLVIFPILFDLLTGLNVGTIMLMDAEEAPETSAPSAEPGQARAWVGFLSIFVILVELTSFWFAIGMGMKLGQEMRAGFSWETFAAAAAPRIVAYVLIIVPSLLASAAAETAAIKAMMRNSPAREEISRR